MNASDNFQKITNLSCFTFANRTRYVVLVLATIALTLAISNSLALNFTIICMKKSVDSIALNNSIEGNEEMFTSGERSALFSATALGTLIGSVPITYLTSNFGFRKLFTCYGLISAIATLSMPLAVSTIGFIATFVLRVLQGVAVSTSFVAMGAISAEWSPTKTSGMYLAWLSCHMQFAPMLTMPTAGELCSTLGWPSVYYLQGGLTLIVFPLFFYFYRDSPRFQRNVSHKELMKIETNKVRVILEKKQKQDVPYRAMLTDTVVWGVVISSCGGMLGFYLIQLFGPVYLNKALKLDIQHTGTAAALPFALSCIVKILAGPISDYVSCITDKKSVILFNSMSQFTMAASYAAIYYLPISQEGLIRVFFTLVIVFSGLATVGNVKGAHLAARHYCHVIMAWNTLSQSVITLILPFVVNFFTPENTPEQWGRIFLATALIITAANLFFITTIDVEPRPWTLRKIEENNNLARQTIQNIMPSKEKQAEEGGMRPGHINPGFSNDTINGAANPI